MLASTDFVLTMLGKDAVIARRMMPGAGNRNPPRMQRRTLECSLDLLSEIDFSGLTLSTPQPNRQRSFGTPSGVSPIQLYNPHNTPVAMRVNSGSECEDDDDDDDDDDDRSSMTLNVTCERTGLRTPPPPQLTLDRIASPSSEAHARQQTATYVLHAHTHFNVTPNHTGYPGVRPTRAALRCKAGGSTLPVEGGCHASEAGHECAVTGSLPFFWDPPRLVR